MIPTPCQVCRGRGRIETEKTLSVKIPAGVDDGSRIRISGSGEAGSRGGPDGDLYVYLSVKRHERYRRDAMDLYIDVPISFPQAALGGEIEVPSMDGPLPLTLHAGTQSGAMYRLRGHGMPSVRGTARGDQLVTVHVVVPTKMSRRERELLEAFASEGGDRVEERSFFERVKEAFKVD
jgi:molecular chaperone DnaJ